MKKASYLPLMIWNKIVLKVVKLETRNYIPGKLLTQIQDISLQATT